MVLGGDADANDDTGAAGVTALRLDGNDARIDAALAAVYDTQPGRKGGGGRSGGLGKSAPAVARWLGDIRRYFPSTVVQVMQRDAIERLQLRQLLLEPEMLGAVEPDLHLVTLLVELNRLLPDATRSTARQLVAQVVEQIRQRLESRTAAAVQGALARSQRTRRPRPADIDWGRTVQANLRHYQPSAGTVIPERLVGYGRRQRSLARDVVVAIDQSGSMADSVVYASVFSAVLASLPALRTQVIAFDTAVADLTPLLHDPVEVLFGVQLGGGTDIAAAIGYCQRLIDRPADTVLVLVSDLFEGGNATLLHERIGALCAWWCCWRYPTRVPRPTTTPRRPLWQRWVCRRSRARPMRFPTCWRLRWSGEMSVAGPTSMGCTRWWRRCDASSLWVGARQHSAHHEVHCGVHADGMEHCVRV
jgi:hypothetical protein